MIIPPKMPKYMRSLRENDMMIDTEDLGKRKAVRRAGKMNGGKGKRMAIFYT